MFIKVVRHLEEEGVSDQKGDDIVKVVPRQQYLFEIEGCPKEITYKKVRVNNMENMNVNTETMEDYTILTPFPIHGSCFEYIEFQIPENGEFLRETFIAPDCSFYVMNNEGRTIDSLHCSTR